MRQAAIGHRKLNFEPRKWQPNNGEQNHNYKNLSKCNSVLSQFVKKSKLGTTIVVRPIVTTAPGTVNSSYRLSESLPADGIGEGFSFIFCIFNNTKNSDSGMSLTKVLFVPLSNSNVCHNRRWPEEDALGHTCINT